MILRRCMVTSSVKYKYFRTWMTLTLRTARATRVMTLTGSRAVMTMMINLHPLHPPPALPPPPPRPPLPPPPRNDVNLGSRQNLGC
jgi:hypothetical protein